MLRRYALLFLTIACLVFGGCGTSGSSLLNSVLTTGSGSQPNEPTGACCLPSGSCLTVTASDCNSFFGVFFGEGLICGIAPCGDLFTP